MRTFFTADLHLGHENIIRYSKRPFSSVREMDRVLIDNWNARVAPGDRVYVLGDFTMGNIEYAKRVLKGLNGERYLLVGNHDRIKSEAKGYEVGFRWTGKELTYQLGPYLVDMSHYPYCNDMEELGYEDKFAARRPKDNGRWLLHGHCHTAWRIKGRQFNVGVDVNNYAPISQEEIIEAIKAEAR